MKCPDRNVLARYLDGEEVKSGDELRRHLKRCARCRKNARQQNRLGMAVEEALRKEARSMVKEAVPCPPPEEIARYIEGGMPLYLEKQLLRHFCACPACARAALDAARAGGADALPPQKNLVREARAAYRKGHGGRRRE